MKLIDHLWYGKSIFAYLLLPFSAVFLLLSLVRLLLYRSGTLKIRHLEVPVVVVGNITAGGSGKTPLVVWLAKYLKAKGYRPGIVSRGYGGRASQWPQQVRADSDTVVVGDEAILLARRTGCPMAVGPDRYEAGKQLLATSDCNILLSDDGLQHYALGRDIEIAVVDGRRRFGNGFLLPAGPLREGQSRLETVDMVIINGEPSPGECSMRLRRGDVFSMDSNESLDLGSFAGQQVHAVAGIGHPERFFTMLRNSGLKVIEHRFADHHKFRKKDLLFNDDLPVIMTEKDAVKCCRLVDAGYWYLQISAQPDARFVQGFFDLLEELEHGQETA
ncbi:MAG: tetraacyldisaccharide 4'-kinase [Chromatiales bacterium]